MRFFVLVSVVVILVAACGGNVVVDSGAGTGGAQGAGGGVSCDDGGVEHLPSAFKGCSTDADCTTEDANGCCETVVLGVANDEVDAYLAYEKACIHGGVPCQCPPGVGGALTEDGKLTPPGTPASTSVACQAGLCLSFTP